MEPTVPASKARPAADRRPSRRRWCCKSSQAAAGLGNIAYVQVLWAAFEAGGVAAMAALVPRDVRWRPLAEGGRVLRGTRELTEFWGSRDVEMPTLRMFHARGDDVLVEAAYRHDDGGVSTTRA